MAVFLKNPVLKETHISIIKDGVYEFRSIRNFLKLFPIIRFFFRGFSNDQTPFFSHETHALSLKGHQTRDELGDCGFWMAEKIRPNTSQHPWFDEGSKFTMKTWQFLVNGCNPSDEHLKISISAVKWLKHVALSEHGAKPPEFDGSLTFSPFKVGYIHIHVKSTGSS
jgi:hypothetical protein